MDIGAERVNALSLLDFLEVNTMQSNHSERICMFCLIRTLNDGPEYGR